MEWRFIIVIIIIVNSIVTYLFEKIVVWYISLWWKHRKDKIKEEKRIAEMSELNPSNNGGSQLAVRRIGANSKINLSSHNQSYDQ